MLSPHPKALCHQHGSALVLSVMVVAFIEVLVVLLLVNQRFLIRQTDNLIQAAQQHYDMLSNEDEVNVK